MTTLIIGYGSTLRRDDGIGFLAAERLMDLLPEDSVIARQQLTPDLADDVSQVDRVIFIDACAKNAPGEIRTEEVRPAGEDWGAFVHEMSPGVLLDCVKQVYGKVPAAQLITIGGEDFSIGEGLSASVATAMETVVAQVSTIYRAG
jgi:hydrogenase maturation protease